ILVEKSEHPGIVLLDKAHHWHGRKLRGAHTGTQREIRDAAICWCEVRGAFKVVFRAPQILFRLDDLRFSLRFGGVSGEKFAFKISEVALCLLEVGPLSGPSCGERRELLDALFRQVDPWGQGGFFVRGIVKLILRSA